MKIVRLMGFLGLLALVGCAHGTMRGTVAMKTAADEGHVCLGNGEVKAGDRVALFKNVCPPATGKLEASALACTKTLLGYGTVERTLNEHYSVVKAEPGVKVEEGAIVEKI